MFIVLFLYKKSLLVMAHCVFLAHIPVSFSLVFFRDIWEQSKKCRQHQRLEEEEDSGREPAEEDPQVSREEASAVQETGPASKAAL